METAVEIIKYHLENDHSGLVSSNIAYELDEDSDSSDSPFSHGRPSFTLNFPTDPGEGEVHAKKILVYVEFSSQHEAFQSVSPSALLLGLLTLTSLLLGLEIIWNLLSCYQWEDHGSQESSNR